MKISFIVLINNCHGNKSISMDLPRALRLNTFQTLQINEIMNWLTHFRSFHFFAFFLSFAKEIVRKFNDVITQWRWVELYHSMVIAIRFRQGSNYLGTSFFYFETEWTFELVFPYLFSLSSTENCLPYSNVEQFLVNILNSISFYSFMQNEYGDKKWN